jgi:hypothetical protein
MTKHLHLSLYLTKQMVQSTLSSHTPITLGKSREERHLGDFLFCFFGTLPHRNSGSLTELTLDLSVTGHSEPTHPDIGVAQFSYD